MGRARACSMAVLPATCKPSSRQPYMQGQALGCTTENAKAEKQHGMQHPRTTANTKGRSNRSSISSLQGKRNRRCGKEGTVNVCQLSRHLGIQRHSGDADVWQEPRRRQRPPAQPATCARSRILHARPACMSGWGAGRPWQRHRCPHHHHRRRRRRLRPRFVDLHASGRRWACRRQEQVRRWVEATRQLTFEAGTRPPLGPPQQSRPQFWCRSRPPAGPQGKQSRGSRQLQPQPPPSAAQSNFRACSQHQRPVPLESHWACSHRQSAPAGRAGELQIYFPPAAHSAAQQPASASANTQHRSDQQHPPHLGKDFVDNCRHIEVVHRRAALGGGHLQRCMGRATCLGRREWRHGGSGRQQGRAGPGAPLSLAAPACAGAATCGSQGERRGGQHCLLPAAHSSENRAPW